MALPQFGIYSNVRVCDDCFNNPSRSVKDGQGSYTTTVAAVVDGVSRLNVDDDNVTVANSISRASVANEFECKCGMPLCICKPPTPVPVLSQNNLFSSSQSNSRPKKPLPNQKTTEISRKPSPSSSSSNSKQSLFLNMGQTSNGDAEKPKSDYDVNGEGLREAIKNSDPVGVRKLLNEGVNANYCDKQGSTPLHLAALFNQTDIAFILMNHGASLEKKNAQGETPLDCAPIMLQYKMRQKMEEGMEDPQASINHI